MWTCCNQLCVIGYTGNTNNQNNSIVKDWEILPERPSNCCKCRNCLLFDWFLHDCFFSPLCDPQCFRELKYSLLLNYIVAVFKNTQCVVIYGQLWPKQTCWALACSRLPRCSTSSVNVGLSVGRSSQQSNMVWYLETQVNEITVRWWMELHFSDMLNCATSTFHSHLIGGIFWGPHPGAFLEPPAERLVDANTRIGRSPCRTYDRGDIAGIQWSLCV